ncbi:hypothetical protein [Streptomyces sp. NBC_00564]|uniref:hypothetical protein n=1 Tax=Streptomyces sp. NBC_00564 TaxID=2903663 RepID=UPI00352EEE27|nr:glycosyltransferase [Streptomyces sp. NBC_00564]
MRLAVVCCDGVPVSGLLTVLRNVVERGIALGAVEPEVHADLGYSWRPDKPCFFPTGPTAAGYPSWMRVCDQAPPVRLPAAELASRFLSIRDRVAEAHQLGADERDVLRGDIDEIARTYRPYFTAWLEEHRVDWLIAVNMTLSDAPGVTLALHQAAEARWGSGRPGGIVFWDHDLFDSCSVHENARRVYPLTPNEFTPVPGRRADERWVVITEKLASEAATYTAGVKPDVLTNLLPHVPPGPLEPRHLAFMAENGLDSDRPVLLAPARIFRPKGIEIALTLLAEIREQSLAGGEPPPYLLVFGQLDEDPAYAAELHEHAHRCGVADDVLFLDGVPVATFRDARGRWRLDEVDLLRLAAADGGAVLFTPSQPDVESVGLGPALAAQAGIPCAYTAYDAFTAVYGDRFRGVHVSTDPEGLAAAATALRAAMHARRRSTGRYAEDVVNQAVVEERFPPDAWDGFLLELADALAAPGPLTNEAGERA